jgi:hypothetical protein
MGSWHWRPPSSFLPNTVYESGSTPPTSSGDWEDALKQLDDNFISSRTFGDDILVFFHNPSVLDFVENFLANSDGDVADLISGAHFYERYTSLWTGRGGQRYRGVDLEMDVKRFTTSLSTARRDHRGHQRNDRMRRLRSSRYQRAICLYPI